VVMRVEEVGDRQRERKACIQMQRRHVDQAVRSINKCRSQIMSINRFIGVTCAIALGFAAVSASADVMVGGSAMLAQKNIVQNALNSKDHTTLVAAVKAA